MTTTNDAPAELPDGRELDRHLEVVADRTRRAVLGEVTRNGARTVDALAERLADGDRSERDEKIRLVHCHLPKLAAAGAVDYDREAGRVEPGSEADSPLFDGVG